MLVQGDGRLGRCPHWLSTPSLALGERDTSLRAMLLARLAREFHWSDIAKGQLLSRLAVEIAQRLGDPPTLVFALNHLRGAIWGRDNPTTTVTPMFE